jgi:multidrug resistance protein
MYTSTFTQIENQFGNSREISNLGLSLYVLGLSLGPMLFGPLSEFYGRRPIYLVSWLFYIIWNIPIAVAGNIQTIMVSRFLGGFSGSAFLAVSGGTVGDLFSKEHLQLPMTIFTAAPFIGPSIGPFIGNFINYYTSWHWTFWVILIWSVTIGLALLIFVPETHRMLFHSRGALSLTTVRRPNRLETQS